MGEWAMSDGATSGGREEKDKGKRGGGTASQRRKRGRGGAVGGTAGRTWVLARWGVAGKKLHHSLVRGRAQGRLLGTRPRKVEQCVGRRADLGGKRRHWAGWMIAG